MYISLLSCVALILQFLAPVVSISSPGSLTREVGQDVVFMVNASNLVGVDWGIRDGNTNKLKQGLIYYNIADGMKLDEKINSTSYAGRISFSGDLSAGQAWLKITKLNINDTNQYIARIATQTASWPQYVIVQLAVTFPPSSASTTRPLTTSTTAGTYASVISRSSNITKSAPRNITSTASSLPSTGIPESQSRSAGGTTCTSITATCVTIIVILVIIVVVLLIYIWKGKEQSARKRNLSSINFKGEDLGAYENANQMEDVSNVRVNKAAKPRIIEKELYETICENIDESANTQPGVGNLAAKEMTTRDPSVSGQDPVPSLPQHYQELTNLPKGRQIPLYEPLNKRNTNHSNDPANNPRTYEQLQQDVTGREYQSLQIIPNKEESKV